MDNRQTSMDGQRWRTSPASDRTSEPDSAGLPHSGDRPAASPRGAKSRVVVLDDDAGTLELLSDLLCTDGYEVYLGTSAKDLRSYFGAIDPDVVLLDWKLTDGDGLDLLPECKRQWPEAQVIMLTNFGSIDIAVEAVKRGAFHFQTKPFHIDSLLLLVQRACEHKALTERTEVLQQAVSTLSSGTSPIFRSPAIKSVLRIVERVASSEATVLITGESGTGKEVIADLIHSLSHRARGPLVKVNCAALPHELIESELFGAVKGAYTGAHTDREGLFRQAEGGTILLDEISEMPLETQSKLLRVLQDREYRPVGGKTVYKADCRVLASTNRRPEDAIRETKLREDLFYRISAVSIHLPPLRERRDDIMPLALSFLKRFAAQSARNVTGFSSAATGLLEQYDWPGNVRQLENEVQRAVLVTETNLIEVSDLSISLATPGSELENLAALEVLERDAILKALERAGGNKTAAARELGVTRQTLYNKIKHYRLDQ